MRLVPILCAAMFPWHGRGFRPSTPQTAIPSRFNDIVKGGEGKLLQTNGVAFCTAHKDLRTAAPTRELIPWQMPRRMPFPAIAGRRTGEQRENTHCPAHDPPAVVRWSGVEVADAKAIGRERVSEKGAPDTSNGYRRFIANQMKCNIMDLRGIRPWKSGTLCSTRG